MKASELRIGNYVNGTYTITEIGMDGVNLIEGDDYASEIYILYNNLKPIPLTEEWLLKFGWGKEGEDYVYLNLKASFKYVSDSVWIGVYDNGCWLRLTYIKHVHQLQNLVHALTGHELKTKQDDK